MKPRILIAILILAGVGLSQQAPVAATAQQAVKGTLRKTIDRKGTFLPAAADDIALEMKVYRGSLKLAEVRPHGSFVNEGDVIARFETEAIDRQLVSDGMALARAEMDLRHADENARLAAQGWVNSLERAERDSLRAVKRLEGFRKHEKAFNKESERMSVQGREHRLEDQRDELTQLEKMYTEDELVDATEEIVLKRQRRNFARNKASYDLSEQRRLYNKEYFEAWREEDLERDARTRAQALRDVQLKNRMAREKLEADLAKRRHDLARTRERFNDLKRERELLVVRSPRRGLLLHGAADAAPWTTHHKAGSTAKSDQVFVAVADPKVLKVKTNLDEGQAPEVGNGTPVEVAPVAFPGKKLMGRIRVDYLPGKDGRFAAEIELAGSEIGLRPGMHARVGVILAEARDVVIIDKANIHTNDEGAAWVWTRPTVDGKWVQRMVVTGLDTGKRVAVLSGVEAGEFVIKDPH